MTEKVYIQIDNEITEAKGKDLEAILEIQSEIQQKLASEESEKEAKASARESALAKLAKLGLTQAEIDAL
jgi:DNA-binding NarL/FixJ family response regulator